MAGRPPIHGWAGTLCVAAAVAAVVTSMTSCENEKKKYLADASPFVAQIDQVAAEMEAIAGLAQDVAKVQEAEQRLNALDERLKNVITGFTSLMAPVDFSYYHGNLVKALASEATGISALKGYFGRNVNASVLAARVGELKTREAALAAEIKDARSGAPGAEKKKLDHQRAKDELDRLTRQQIMLVNEMDGQMKYYRDNHRFFKGHLRVYREAVIKGSP